MTDKEKKILEQIEQATDDIKIPESLEPENIQKKLEAQRGRKLRPWKRQYTYAAAAACLTLVLGGTVLFQQFEGTEAFMEKENTSTEKGDIAIGNQIAKAEDYDEIYKYVKQKWEDDRKQMESSEMIVNDSTQLERGVAMEAKSMDASTGGYSDTNVRTEGVGEADSVKTDGKYLYALKESAREIAIIDPSGGEMKTLATIKLDNDAQSKEFYVSEGKLYVFATVPVTKVDDKNVEFYHSENATLLTYDLADVANPKQVSSHSQSGRYVTSRFVDGYIYMFSSFYVQGECKPEERDYYVPSVNGKAVPLNDIYMPPMQYADQYTVVTSIKADAPDEIVDQKAVLANNGQCYVGTDSIYIYESVWKGGRWNPLTEGMVTAIRKISYDKGSLSAEAQGKVNGYIHDSFCIDEYDGYLRVVATISGKPDTTNAVYVLDDTLEIKGKITDLAKGEEVYSARMFGKIGYFVTYRQVDPLFSVDFSDPENPEIIGTLKIPGFSEYLHPYGDGLLLGIGMDTDEESGVTNGVKVSMFDSSDPTDVKEVQKYIIKGAYSSDVFHDYRAVLIDKEKDMIGFSVYGNSEMYYVFGYDDTNGFQVKMEEEVNGSSYMGTRGVYIDNMLYVVKGNAIESYKMDGFVKVDDLLL